MLKKIVTCLFLGVFLAAGTMAVPAAAASIADSESAAHSDAAAGYQVQAVYEGTDLRIVQFNLGVLSHYSYLIISDGKVLMVDPGRDVATYLDYAAREKLEWAGTFLTHSHADFVAGHIEMALATGKPIYSSHKSGAEYAHLELKEEDKIVVGKAIVRILETPGHTPDSLCGVVSPAAHPEKQEFLLSGDTLFVGSLGRPDLMGGTYSAAELAGMMFETWNKKLATLDDRAVVLPAHGAGSLCGANLSDAPSSTIAQEKKSNYYLKYTGNKSAFITKFLTGLEPAPAYFGENARINRVGPETVNWANPLGSKVENLAELIDQKEVYLVDVREAAPYAEKHVPRSINISLRGRTETWTGIIVPFKARIVVIGNLEEITEATRRLKRVGYNADYALLEEYLAAGGRTSSTRLYSPADLREKMVAGNAPVVVDVRRPAEWLGMKIGEVLNIPLDIIEKQAPSRLNKGEEVVAVCNSAFRSSMAIGLLERAGFSQPTSMQGGSEAWIEAGYPVVKIDQTTGSVPHPVQNYRNLGLPERISAAQLKQLIKDLPGTFEIIDIRPADQVSDYNPVNAQAVDLAALLESQTWLVGDVPLIIVDRDGSLAMMAAGIVSRKTSRPIKALQGGIEAYWRETEMKFRKDIMLAPAPVKSPGSEGQIPRIQLTPDSSGEKAAPAAPAAPSVPEAKPVRKGAGC